MIILTMENDLNYDVDDIKYLMDVNIIKDPNKVNDLIIR